MESVKEAERTVIVKPVASRPSCSSFRSFADLLIDTSSPSEAVVPAIRPKTVRFKPMVNPAISTAGLTSSRAGIFSDKFSSKSDGKTAAATATATTSSTTTTTVVYKPLAKVVAKSTVSLLASMGNFNNKSVNKQTQAPPPPPRRAESKVREASKSRQNYQSAQRELDDDKNDDDNNDTTNTNDKSVAASDARASLSLSSSYDGYNWRKYGQKQVKGSEYPRSYYKCTHPGCPVKKKVESSLDGQIAEIVYKAEHNHSKPQPAAKKNNNNNNKRSNTSSAASSPERTTATTTSAAHQACSEGVISNNKDRVSELGFACSCSYNCRGCFVENNNVVVVEAAEEEGLMMSKGIIEGDDDQEDYDQARSNNKKRKAENNQLSSVAEAGAQECQVVVQNSSDPEVSGDGFRWRKYGQKVVKGNPYPRSYYRCTGLKCNVRKHVERASDDPKAFITTYEGKHNHEMPIKNPNKINNYSHTD